MKNLLIKTSILIDKVALGENQRHLKTQKCKLKDVAQILQGIEILDLPLILYPH